MRPAWRWLLSLGLGGCSLLGLDAVEGLACTPGETGGICEHLNREARTVGQCFAFQCTAEGRGCTRRARDHDLDGYADGALCSASDLPGEELDCDDTDAARQPYTEELCDARDNDCDSIVDEGVLGSAGDPNAVLGSATDELMAAGDSNSAESLLFVGAAEGAGLAVITGGTTRRKLDYHYSCDRDPEDLLHCPGPRGPQACKIDQLAAATAGDRIIAAGVTRAGGKARLRIGLVDLASEPAHIELGVGARDSSGMRYGVEAETPAACSCDELDVDRPQLAGLAEGTSRQALAVWLARLDSEHETCGMARAVGVKALAVAVVPGRAGTADTLVASDGGAPKCFGMSASSGPLSLVTAQSQEAGGAFVVAYPDGDKHVALARFRSGALGAGVTAQRYTASELCMPLEEPDALSSELCSRDSRGPFTLAEPDQTVLSDFGESVEHVALSLAPASEAGRRMLIATRSGCDFAATIRIGTVTLDDAFAGAPVENLIVLRSGDPATGRRLVAGPSLAYVSDGFIAGTARDPVPRARGGWLVVWTEETDGDRSVLGMRVAERDGRSLEQQPFPLPSSSVKSSTQSQPDAEVFVPVVTQVTAFSSLRGMQCSN